MPRRLPLLAVLALAAPARAADPPPWEKAVADAAKKPPMTAAEAEAFVKRLHAYVRDHHLKADPKSPQRGMVYEYVDTTRLGKPDRWVQGEALDTMHDGAWYALAMAHAFRATGDRTYRDFLKEYQLPFYTRVLNHSDTLFDTKQVDVAEKGVRFNKEHALQPGEKGFCPYWWDDGASVSLERRRLRDPLAKPPFACTDLLAGKPNPDARLTGYSHGSSNHLAQDLGPMLMVGWLTFRESADPAEKALAADCALAAKHLHECRLRHHGSIPAVFAAAGVTNGDKDLLKRVGEPKLTAPANHYTRFLLAAGGPEQRHSTPGFMDDAAYTYYTHLATGKIPPAVRFKLVYDTFTEPQLFRYWVATYPHWLDVAKMPGLNRFDLAGGPYGKGGRFESYPTREKSLPPPPVGSRFGPQNMVVSAWALQLLDEAPGLWDKAVDQLCRKDLRAGFTTAPKFEAKPKPEGSEPFELGGATLRVAGLPGCLAVGGTFGDEKLECTIAGAPDDKAGRAVLTVRSDGSWSAVNGAGEKLELSGWTRGTRDGSPTSFVAILTGSVFKDQGRWLNAVELGRYTLTVGKESKTFVLASSEKQVRAALERELAGGLRTWEAIFDTLGYVPTGLGAGKDWDAFSDTGGYAHLISAASQYLLWKAGKRDWEAHAVPR
jgi:hypothetical protein